MTDVDLRDDYDCGDALDIRVLIPDLITLVQDEQIRADAKSGMFDSNEWQVDSWEEADAIVLLLGDLGFLDVPAIVAYLNEHKGALYTTVVPVVERALETSRQDHSLPAL